MNSELRDLFLKKNKWIKRKYEIKDQLNKLKSNNTFNKKLKTSTVRISQVFSIIKSITKADQLVEATVPPP